MQLAGGSGRADSAGEQNSHVFCAIHRPERSIFAIRRGHVSATSRRGDVGHQNCQNFNVSQQCNRSIEMRQCAAYFGNNGYLWCESAAGVWVRLRRRCGVARLKRAPTAREPRALNLRLWYDSSLAHALVSYTCCFSHLCMGDASRNQASLTSAGLHVLQCSLRCSPRCRPPAAAAVSVNHQSHVRIDAGQLALSAMVQRRR